MTSRIIRWEIKGDEVFLNVEITNDTDIWTKAEWLTPTDAALVISDNGNINTMATQLANRAVLARTAELVQIEHDRALAIEQAKLETARILYQTELLKTP